VRLRGAAGILAVSFLSGILLALEGTAAGVRWNVPVDWTAGASRPMRVATYVLPPAKGGEPPECGVYFFGKGQGGGVEENVKRWSEQFEGSPRPSTRAQTVAGLTVHRVALSGTYRPAGGPMMQPQAPRPGYRLLGAIVEAPGGLVFFKCTGPAAAIDAAEKGFDALIASLSKAATTV
jgi:hypothetical protein